MWRWCLSPEIDILDATPTVDLAIKEAIRLIKAVRASGRQAEALDFVAHARSVAREADEAMMAGIAVLNSAGRLDDTVFARIYAAGCSHSAMMALCDSNAEDPSETVRTACAAGLIVLRAITASADHARVINEIQRRHNDAA